MELCDRDEAIKLYNDNSKDVDETIKALKGGKTLEKGGIVKKERKQQHKKKMHLQVILNLDVQSYVKRRMIVHTLYGKEEVVFLPLLIFIGCFTGYYHLCMVYRICMNNVDPAVPQIHTDRFIPFMIFGILFSFGHMVAMSESYKNLFVYALLAFTYSIVMLVYGVELGDLGDKASGNRKIMQQQHLIPLHL